ncbi:hypothetical protein WMY93_003565 [Mugilogobius chulae]|uniref:G-protein coupled receptors family 1 profile domain-containing protein n=1 Tax=Mugilogobius chulae TaxID=88201 RepID=A0AAW0PZQ5_9GOBI
MATEGFHSAYAAVPPSMHPMTPPTRNFLKMFGEYQSNDVIIEHYNFTGKLKENKYKEGLKPEAIAFLLVCLLIVLENAIVLIALWRNKKFHVPMYYLLGNLTLSDLLAGFTYMVNIITSGANTLNMTPVLWFLREGGVFIMLAASVISLLAIAIERHVTMVRMKPYQGDKQGRMFALIGASWTNTQRLGSGSQRKGLSRKSQKYLALLKTVTIVLGVFIACWSPLFILLLMDFFCPTKSCQVLFKADYFLGIAMFNSLLNPIIYTLTSKDMRRAILRLLCRHCLLTSDGHMKKIGIPFLECSTSKTDATSHRLEGLETTVSSGNFTPSTIKVIYPKMLKS